MTLAANPSDEPVELLNPFPMRPLSSLCIALALTVTLVTLSGCNEAVQANQSGSVTFLAGGEAPQEGASLPTIVNDTHMSLPAEQQPLVGAGNDFGLKLFQRLLDNPYLRGNLILSPISLETALGMNALGLSDEAFEEYRSAMGFSTGHNALTVATYLKNLNEVMSSAGEYSCFFPTNSFWVSSKYQEHLIQSYPQLLFDYFGATSATLDLSQPKSYEAINEWISRKTYGRIRNMLDPSAAEDQDPYSFLVNTAFFAASWEWQASEAATQAGHFLNRDGKQEPAMMMSIYEDSSIDFTENDRYEAISVGLLSGEEQQYGVEAPFRMLLILPKDPTQPLAKCLPQLEELQEFTTSSDRYALHIRLPRLDTKTRTLDLTQELMALGLVKSMGIPLTELSRMFDPLFLAQQMELTGDRQNRVYHKASLKWDEESVEAAAATVMGPVFPSAGEAPKERKITFDRPFFACIVHPETGKILFIAAINTLQK